MCCFMWQFSHWNGIKYIFIYWYQPSWKEWCLQIKWMFMKLILKSRNTTKCPDLIFSIISSTVQIRVRHTRRVHRYYIFYYYLYYYYKASSLYNYDIMGRIFTHYTDYLYCDSQFWWSGHTDVCSYCFFYILNYTQNKAREPHKVEGCC